MSSTLVPLNANFVITGLNKGDGSNFNLLRSIKGERRKPPKISLKILAFEITNFV